MDGVQMNRSQLDRSQLDRVQFSHPKYGLIESFEKDKEFILALIDSFYKNNKHKKYIRKHLENTMKFAANMFNNINKNPQNILDHLIKSADVIVVFYINGNLNFNLSDNIN